MAVFNPIYISSNEDYEGLYDITPMFEEQVLETENKIMTNDLTVQAIPYYEVSNAQGGQTIIIGG